MAKYTKQQAFDIAYLGLLRQGKRSMDPKGTHCAYRGAEGRKCAVGMLMTDEELTRALEEAYANRPALNSRKELGIENGMTPDDFPKVCAEIVEATNPLEASTFLRSLQCELHDHVYDTEAFLPKMKSAAKSFAFRHYLNVPEEAR